MGRGIHEHLQLIQHQRPAGMATAGTKTVAKLRARRAGGGLKRRVEKEVGHLAGNHAG